MTAILETSPLTLGRLTTDELARLVGATYRQVDYWVRHGYLTPDRAQPGSGVARIWTPEDLRVAGVVAQLRRMGAAADAVKAAARWLYTVEDLPAVDAGWLVLTPLRLFPEPAVDVVATLDGLERLVGAGAWVVPIPDLIG